MDQSLTTLNLIRSTSKLYCNLLQVASAGCHSKPKGLQRTAGTRNQQRPTAMHLSTQNRRRDIYIFLPAEADKSTLYISQVKQYN